MALSWGQIQHRQSSAKPIFTLSSVFALEIFIIISCRSGVGHRGYLTFFENKGSFGLMVDMTENPTVTLVVVSMKQTTQF